MAHRLITSMSKFDRILKNGLLTGNSNNIPQAQLRFSEVKLLPQSRAFSDEPRTKFDKPLRLKEDNNGGALKTNEKGTAENKKNDKRTKNLTCKPKFEPNALNQDFTSAWLVSVVVEEGIETIKTIKTISVICLMVNAVILIGFKIAMLTINFWWRDRENINYEEITLTDFVNNYLNRERVVKHEYIEEQWIQFQTPGDAS